MESLELRDLRYFLAVADELNFTRAAVRLHIAQQGLSAAIARLEGELGVVLFTRTTRKVELTSAGEALLDPARKVLAAASEALERVHEVAAGRRGRLSVGFSTATRAVPVVREILRSFSEESSEVEIRTLEYDFSDPSAGLAGGEVDVAFVFGPLELEGMSSLTLLKEQRLVAMRPDHALASKSSVSPPELAAQPWLRVPAPVGPWVDFWFSNPGAGNGGAAGPVIRTADEWVAAIEAGRGVAYTMPTVMRGFPDLAVVTLPVTDLPPATVLLAWRAREEDPLVLRFVGRARTVIDKQS